MNHAVLKRPLAFLGGGWFAALLAAVWVPAAARLPLAALCTAAFLLLFFVCRKRENGCESIAAPLVLLAVALAFWACSLHTALVVAPLQRLADKEYVAQALVVDTAPAHGGDTVTATLKVTHLQGEEGVSHFRIRLYGLQDVEIGDKLSLRLRFYTIPALPSAGNYTRGFYIGARVVDGVHTLGSAPDLAGRLRLVQYAASENIRARLPQRYSGVAAAMAVGDSRHMDASLRESFRAAGLSHLLVVSGMHFSILCALVAGAVYRPSHRPKIGAVLCICFVLMFVLFTGLSPSVVRSGVAYLLVFAAGLFYRRADIYTSLGFAALLLGAQNPYAAADVGVWLSFMATLGTMAGSHVAKKYHNKLPRLPRAPRLRKVLAGLSENALVTLFATLATLPVLVAAGYGVSLLSPFYNLLALPLAAPSLVCGLALAVPRLPVIEPLFAALALLEALLLRGLELVALLGENLGGLVYFSGVAAVSTGLIFPLVLWGVKQRRVKSFSLLACGLLLFSLALQAGLCYNTVTLAVAGRGENASLVAVCNDKAAVLYRSSREAAEITETLRRHGASCELLIDLRQAAQGTEYIDAFAPQKTVIAQRDVVYREIYRPFAGVTIYVGRQAKGFYAVADVGGYTAGIYTGRVNLQSYPSLDLLLAGRGEAMGEFARVLTGENPPAWVEAHPSLWHITGRALVRVRPYKSVRFGGMRRAA